MFTFTRLYCCPPCGLIIHFLNHRLDYPGVGPEHSFLKDIGRAEYDSVTDQEALDGMFLALFPSSVLVELIFNKLSSNAPTKCCWHWCQAFNILTSLSISNFSE